MSFPFMQLPAEIQHMVMEKLPAPDLLSFRHSSKHCSKMTDKIRRRPTGSSKWMHRTVHYSRKQNTFEATVGRNSTLVPTSNFWNYYVNHTKLQVKNLQEEDADKFLESYQQSALRFKSADISNVSVKSVEKILMNLTEIDTISLWSPEYFTNEFLMSDILKYISCKGGVHGMDSAWSNYSDHGNTVVPVKGINHSIKLWMDETYVFDYLVFSPVTADTNLSAIFDNIQFVSIYDKDNHDESLLREIDPKTIPEMDGIWRIMYAVRNQSGKVLHVSIKDDKMIMRTMQEENVIHWSLRNLLDCNYDNYPMEQLMAITDKNLF